VEPSETTRTLDVLRLGRTGYADAYELQQGLLEQRIAGAARDTLVLTEHEPVVTVGRKTPAGAVTGVDVPVFEIERGGEATYHGPGQVVGYPIVELPPERRDLHRYLRDLEEVLIRVLAEFDVAGTRRAGLTGVWIGERKVASIGVAVRRWVTWHGFALNVHTDLAGFRSFNPCGLRPDVMTRLVDHAELGPGNLLVEVLCVKHFCEVFGYELPPPARPAQPTGGYPELPILG
jgi:lipoate-protein ligase B